MLMENSPSIKGDKDEALELLQSVCLLVYRNHVHKPIDKNVIPVPLSTADWGSECCARTVTTWLTTPAWQTCPHKCLDEGFRRL